MGVLIFFCRATRTFIRGEFETTRAQRVRYAERAAGFTGAARRRERPLPHRRFNITRYT